MTATFLRSWWAKVLLLTLLGLGVRLAYVAAYQRCDPINDEACTETKLSGDGAYYHNAANLLADGKGFIEPFRYFRGGVEMVDVEMADGTIAQREVVTPVGHVEPTAGHPPVWVTVLGTASFLGLRSVLAHQIVAAFVSIAAIPLCALVGRRLVGERVGLIAAAIAALYTMFWISDGLLMSETSVLVVVPLIMLAGLRFIERPDAKGAVLFGVAGALGALTRAELALFLPIVAAVTLIRATLPWRRRIALYAVCGVTALAVISPWIARNLTVFEHPVYLSNGAGTVMVQANCDGTYYGEDIGYWDYTCGTPMPYGPNGELLDESERDVVVRERALTYIKGHTTRLVTAVIPARIGRMFSVVQPIRQLDLEVLFEDRPYRLSAIGLAEYYALAAAAIGGAVALWRRRLPVLPIALWIGLVAFTAGFAFGNMRYRSTAEPAIAILAAVGIDALWSRLRPRVGATRDGTIAAYPVVPATERPLTAAHRAWAWLTATTPRRARPVHADTAAASTSAPLDHATTSAPLDHATTSAPLDHAGGRGASMPHLPALDGLRGVAVIGVLLFHGGYSWAKGGFLGVSTFFTLSGFLITNLLVREFDRSSRIRLGAFWARRFRRLLPAAVAGLAGIALYGWAFGSPEQLAELRGDIIAALLYVANWRFYFSGQSYGELFSAPSPVQHFWSLAIEEQFYVVFPVLVLVTMRLGGRRALWTVLGILAATSVTLSFVLSDQIDQVYYGTHTRAFEILAGALLAVWWSGRRITADAATSRSSTTPVLLAAAGAAAFVATVAAWYFTDQDTERLGRGGLALHATLVGVVVLAITRRGPLTSLLSLTPLRWIGFVSYGLYVYHWPIFLVLSPERTDLSTTPLFVVRMLATGAVAFVSYHVLEQPIRRARRLRTPRKALVAVPAAAMAVVLLAVTVTIDPPPSTIAYADAEIGPVTGVVNEVDPSVSVVEPGDPALPLARTVMIVGDSGMADTTPAISAAFRATGASKIIESAGAGFGLTQERTPWREPWAELVAEHDPDLVVAMLGGWDLEYLEENGDAAYAAVVDEAVGVLTSNGARVVWLSMLPGGNTPEREADRVYQQLPARHPGVVDFWDIGPALEGPDGGWPRGVENLDGSFVFWRKPDLFHMCPEGAERVAESVLARAIDVGWTQAAVVQWEDGEWRASPLYDDPPGGCVVRD